MQINPLGFRSRGATPEPAFRQRPPQPVGIPPDGSENIEFEGWEDEKPVVVQVHLDFIERMETEISRGLAFATPSDLSGLLVGRMVPDGERHLILVDDYELVRYTADDESPRFARDDRLAERVRVWGTKKGPQEVVGFFRSRRGGWATFDAMDVRDAKRLLPGKRNIFLLIRAAKGGESTAMLFLRRAKSRILETPYGEFIFDVRPLRAQLEHARQAAEELRRSAAKKREPKAPMPKVEAPVPKAEAPVRKAEIPVPKAEVPVPKAEVPVPKAEVPVPKAEATGPAQPAVFKTGKTEISQGSSAQKPDAVYSPRRDTGSSPTSARRSGSNQAGPPPETIELFNLAAEQQRTENGPEPETTFLPRLFLKEIWKNRWAPIVSGLGDNALRCLRAPFRLLLSFRFSFRPPKWVALVPTWGLAIATTIWCTDRPAPKHQAVNMAPHAVAVIDPIDLRVRRDQDLLEVNWNTSSAEIMNSWGGVMIIRDGRRVKAIRLDELEMHTGRIYVQSKSSDLGIRLEVASRNGSGSTESIRVVAPSS